MKKTINVFLLLLLVTFGGCSLLFPDDDPDDCYPNYSSCDTIPDDLGPLRIKLTIDGENPVVPVTVFLGNIEDNDTIYYEEVTESSLTIQVWVDEEYSASAIYQSEGRTIRAIDGDKVKLTSNTDCYETCYSVSPGNINLRLRN